MYCGKIILLQVDKSAGVIVNRKYKQIIVLLYFDSSDFLVLITIYHVRIYRTGSEINVTFVCASSVR